MSWRARLSRAATGSSVDRSTDHGSVMMAIWTSFERYSRTAGNCVARISSISVAWEIDCFASSSRPSSLAQAPDLEISPCGFPLKPGVGLVAMGEPLVESQDALEQGSVVIRAGVRRIPGGGPIKRPSGRDGPCC